MSLVKQIELIGFHSNIWFKSEAGKCHKIMGVDITMKVKRSRLKYIELTGFIRNMLHLKVRLENGKKSRANCKMS